MKQISARVSYRFAFNNQITEKKLKPAVKHLQSCEDSMLLMPVPIQKRMKMTRRSRVYIWRMGICNDEGVLLYARIGAGIIVFVAPVGV
jgi:hypothetical protein